MHVDLSCLSTKRGGAAPLLQGRAPQCAGRAYQWPRGTFGQWFRGVHTRCMRARAFDFLVHFDGGLEESNIIVPDDTAQQLYVGRSNTPGGVRFGVMGLTCESDLDSSQGPTRSPEMYGTQFTTSYDRTRAHNSVRRFHGPRRSYIAVGEQRGAQKHAPMRAAPLLNGPAAPHGRPSQPPTQKHA